MRALVTIDATTFASASRDTTVIVWKRLENNNYQQESQFTNHNHFVNSLAFIPPSLSYPSGLVVSGGSDKVIFGFDPYNPSMIAWKLEGHVENVCALAIGPKNEVISGSWDKY